MDPIVKKKIEIDKGFMRADRLLSILILLQNRGMMTARTLARELEVSERTIYRDMDALSSARFPVYADKGKGGGYALLSDYDLDLAGFNSRDIQALAALNIPGSMDEIGLGSGLRTALTKLLSALHADPEKDQAWMQSRFYMHTPNHIRTYGKRSNLPLIQKAVWEDRLISCRLRYPIHFGLSNPFILAPYTLITSEQQWFIIAARKTFTRVYPLESLTEIQLLSEAFERPTDFDPQLVWHAWLKAQEQQRNNFNVLARVRSDMIDWLPYFISWHYELINEDDIEIEGWKQVRFYFDNLQQARTQILGLGSAIEVIQPESLRKSIIDYAKIINNIYQ